MIGRHLLEVFEHACRAISYQGLGISINCLTLQNHAISNKVFNVTLSLRENKEDIHNAAFDKLSKFILFV